QDTLHEGTETIDVTGASGTLDVTKAVISLTDDDAAPSFAVADASAAEGEAITFTVTRSGATGAAATVKWNTADDPAEDARQATAGTDYTAVTTARTLSFAVGDSAKTFTVATAEDSLHEGDETFLVQLTAATGGATIATGEATGTITDDDAAPTALTLTVDADTGTQGVQGSIAEDGGAKTVRVTATLGGTSTFTKATTVTVQVGKPTDSAREGTDYTTVADQNITIAAGASSGSVDFTLTPTQDVLHEGSESISLDGTSTGLTVTGTQLSLTDDDAAPSAITLTVDADTGTDGVQSSVAEGGGAKTVRVTATLSGNSRFPAAKTVVLAVGKATDSAKEGTDYTEVGAVSITIDANSASGSATFTLTPADDTIDDDAESLTVEGSVTGESGVTVSPVSIAIDDNDGAPTGIALSVNPSTVAENAATAATITVTATVTGGTTFEAETTVAVTVGDSDDTATSGEDYAAVESFDIDIPAGATSATGSFSLDPTDDAIAEGAEKLTVSGASGSIKVTDTEVTITDDEGTPTATLALSPSTINESGNGNASTVTATLSRASSKDLTLTVSAGSGVTLSANKVLTIDAGETESEGTVTLTAEDNDVDAADLAVTVSATASGGNGVANPADQTLTVRDDDARGVTVSKASLSVRETDDGTTNGVKENEGTYTVVLDSEPAAGTVTVAVTSGDTEAATVSPARLTFNTTNWNAAQTVTVTGVDDDTDNANDRRVVTVTHAVSTTGDGNDYAALASADPVTVTVTDDDAAPGGITLSVDTPSLGEGAGATEVKVTATVTGATRFAEAQTVAVSVGGGTAMSATDYKAVAAFNVTIPAMAASGSASFTLTPTDDDVDEDSETIDVTGTLTGVTVTKATISLTDDDTRGVTV
ncbi:MAG: hypothetical protein OXE81_01730, partial [Gammaproteobacteria bacterium]|nr:hypothetical protein [Gammaproteobacteria bacterium]